MKYLHLDLHMGAAGDMLAAALYDLMPRDMQRQYLTELNAALFGIAEISAELCVKCGVLPGALHGDSAGGRSGTDVGPEKTGSARSAGLPETVCGMQLHVRTAAGEEHTEDVHGGHHAGEEHVGHGHDDHMQTDHECGEYDPEGHGDHDYGKYTHSEHDHHVHGDHEHHGHGAHHHGRTLGEVLAVVDSLPLSRAVKEHVHAVYATIAEAEASVHESTPSEVHFHEVGSLDAIADITAVSLAIGGYLKPERITATPVRTGFGHVHCAHGILPVPAPATAKLLAGLPTETGEVEGELCTPTGAALVRHFAEAYIPDVCEAEAEASERDEPEYGIPAEVQGTGAEKEEKAALSEGQSDMGGSKQIGRGFGKKKFPVLNCLTAYLSDVNPEGITDHRIGNEFHDTVIELSCNLDDMTGEEIGFASEELLRAGALDVWTQGIQMKKSRPGVLLSVLAGPADESRMTELLFRLTTTIGVRKTVHSRSILRRGERILEAEGQSVRVKESAGFGISRMKAEYEDLAAIARKEGKSLREARETI